MIDLVGKEQRQATIGLGDAGPLAGELAEAPLQLERIRAGQLGRDLRRADGLLERGGVVAHPLVGARQRHAHERMVGRGVDGPLEHVTRGADVESVEVGEAGGVELACRRAGRKACRNDLPLGLRQRLRAQRFT